MYGAAYVGGERGEVGLVAVSRVVVGGTTWHTVVFLRHCPKGEGGISVDMESKDFSCGQPIKHVDVKSPRHRSVDGGWMDGGCCNSCLGARGGDSHSGARSPSPSRLAWVLHTGPFALQLRRLTQPAIPVDILGLWPLFAAVWGGIRHGVSAHCCGQRGGGATSHPLISLLPFSP